jgi:N-acyl-D-amino-acid deacylase
MVLSWQLIIREMTFRLTLFLVLLHTVRGQGVFFQSVSVVDGTGAAARRVGVRVLGDRIVAVGSQAKAASGDEVVDGQGLVLAPGFIDLHNHSDRGLGEDPFAKSQVSQGITTAVLGMDGGSPFPIKPWVTSRRASPVAINTLVMVGHATIRTKVMGKDYRRKATASEVDAMATLVDQAMREGAIGMSSGLEYEVGSYSSTEEIIALAKVVAKYRGLYMSHIRDEADLSFSAIEEVVRIAREARVSAHISHIKLGTVGVWGKAPEAVAMINKARTEGLDITADCYPYDAWSSTINVLVPNKQYEDPASVQKALEDVGGPQNVLVTNCREHREYEFKNLAEIAKMKDKTAVDIFIEIVRSGGASVVGKTMKESDIKTFYQQPWVMVASDGGIGMRHPRATGSFPKVLGSYVRDQHWFELPEAIRKMTSAPAQRVGLRDRGVIREGAFADLVLFDPLQVRDQSTFADPGRLSIGVRQVFVNGKSIWKANSSGVAPSGRFIPRDELLPLQQK